MTREEAIQWLKDISWQMGSVKRWQNIEAIDMAIEALSTTNTENVSNYGTDDVRSRCEVDAKYQSDDLISRAEALEIISEAQDGSGNIYNILQPIFTKVNALPSVSTERVGEWIFDTQIPIGDGRTSAGYICSNCGKDYFKVDGMHYCPNCGARMIGGAE